MQPICINMINIEIIIGIEYVMAIVQIQLKGHSKGY